MSKKSRQSRAHTAAQTTATGPTPAAPASRSPRETGFNPDYTYVRKDLRRIGVLAGTFVVLMIIASFFFR